MVRAYTYSKRGKPANVLQLDQEYKLPSLEDDHLHVKVEVVGLNPVDWKLMSLVPSFIGPRPALAASDYSGTIIASKSPEFAPGDKVYGIVHSSVKMAKGWGSLAEEIIAPALSCAKRPEALNDAIKTAGVSLAGLTAIVLANQVPKIDDSAADAKQQRILVCGGASSVGLSLVSVLHHRGHFVATTCSKAKENLVLERGADQIFDYKKGNLPEQLTQYVEANGQFDAVLDCADAFDVWQTCNQILKADGAYTNVGMNLTQGILPVLHRLFSYFLRPAWLGGVARTYKRPKEIATKETMAELSLLVAQGVIVPLIDSEFAFEDTLKAFDRLMSNRATGKVIIRVV